MTSAPPSGADLEALFTSCVRKTFSNQDVKAIQQTCSRLATFCQVSSAVYDPHRKVFQDFRERYALAHGDVSAEKAKLSKKEKKKAQKEKKKAEKAKKKAKKEEKKKAKKEKKKAKKGDKKGKNKKDKKKDKKAKKEQKKKEKKEQKKAKEAKKKAKKEQKKKEKAEEKARTPEEKKQHKLAKKEKQKAEKVQKQAKKEQKKLAKKAKKQEREQSKKEGKLIEQEQKLLKQEAKLAEKIRNFVLKNEQRQANLPRVKLSPSKIEKRLDEVRTALSARDTSVSRFAPCLLFTSDTGKDADSQCAVLKRASEFTLQAEECWAGYLSTLQHCKQNASKKKVKACYATFELANARCGSLATKGRAELQKLVGASATV